MVLLSGEEQVGEMHIIFLGNISFWLEAAFLGFQLKTLIRTKGLCAKKVVVLGIAEMFCSLPI